jgi:hypothetical protein
MATNIPQFSAKVSRNGKIETRFYQVTVDAANGANMTVTDMGLDGKGPGQDVFTSNKQDKYKTVLSGVALSLKPDFQKSLSTTVAEQANIHRANFLKTAAVSHLEDYKDVPGIKNVEAQQQNQTATPGSSDNESNPFNVEPITPEEFSKRQETDFPLSDRSKGYEKLPKSLTKLYYPETLEANKYHQDYVKFTVIRYKPRVFSSSGLARAERYQSDNQKNQPFNSFIESEIKLPIQGGISDTNNVNWGAEPLDAIRQALGFSSLTMGMSEDVIKSGGKIIDSAMGLVKDKDANEGIQIFLRTMMAKMAISSESNFFSRAFGAILNPNMELLFQNVELRPFSFRFDLTPRTAGEAELVRKIIRVFKQTMAPRQGIADLFLATPMVYKIKYIKGNGGKNSSIDHPSINRIKTCALKSFNVNYTPNNQYMTYNDNAATMTAYALEMQFVELEPVYFDDYNNFKDDEIGY